jgi:hypothetical protein
MKKFLLLGLMLVLAGCAYKHQPIYNPTDVMPFNAQSASQDRIQTAIVEAGRILHWRVESAGPGHMIATQAQEKFSATVDIFFDQKTWRIVYKESSGLRAEGDKIHSHYNLWVRNLEREIDSRLAGIQPR